MPELDRDLLLAKTPPSEDDLRQRLAAMIEQHNSLRLSLPQLLGLEQQEASMLERIIVEETNQHQDWDSSWDRARRDGRLIISDEGALFTNTSQANNPDNQAIAELASSLSDRVGQPVVICWPRPSAPQIARMPEGWLKLVLPRNRHSYWTMQIGDHSWAYDYHVSHPSWASGPGGYVSSDVPQRTLGWCGSHVFLPRINPFRDPNERPHFETSRLVISEASAATLEYLLVCADRSRSGGFSAADRGRLRQGWSAIWQRASLILNAAEDSVGSERLRIAQSTRALEMARRHVEQVRESLVRAQAREAEAERESLIAEALKLSIVNRALGALEDRQLQVSRCLDLPQVEAAWLSDDSRSIFLRLVPLVLDCGLGGLRRLDGIVIEMPLSGQLPERICGSQGRIACHPGEQQRGQMSLLDRAGASVAYAQALGSGDCAQAAQILIGALARPVADLPRQGRSRWPAAEAGAESGWLIPSD